MNYTAFQKDLQAKLSKRLNQDNVLALPKLDKVVVSIGIWSLHTRTGVKDFSEIEKNLAMITGQQPVMINAKKSVSNFKLREGTPSMLKVTLRGEKAYYFLFKLLSIVLPRVRDFSGLSPRSFDEQGNLSLGIKSYEIFPELHPDDIKIPAWVQVTIATTASDAQSAQALLEEYGFVFQS